MRVYIRIKQPADHALVLCACLGSLGLEEVHASLAQRDRDLHVLVTSYRAGVSISGRLAELRTGTTDAPFGACVRQRPQIVGRKATFNPLPRQSQADLESRAHGQGVLLDRGERRPPLTSAFEAGDGALGRPHPRGNFLLRHTPVSASGDHARQQFLQDAIARKRLDLPPLRTCPFDRLQGRFQGHGASVIQRRPPQVPVRNDANRPRGDVDIGQVADPGSGRLGLRPRAQRRHEDALSSARQAPGVEPDQRRNARVNALTFA